MLNIPAGVRFLKRVFHNSRIFDDAYTGNSTTYYNLGFKRFGLNFGADLRYIRQIGSVAERDIIAEIMLDYPANPDDPKGERH
jgi:ABC-type sulfate transport system substrate-binding protein